jgi:hypothetical protein
MISAQRPRGLPTKRSDFGQSLPRGARKLWTPRSAFASCLHRRGSFRRSGILVHGDRARVRRVRLLQRRAEVALCFLRPATSRCPLEDVVESAPPTRDWRYRRTAHRTTSAVNCRPLNHPTWPVAGVALNPQPTRPDRNDCAPMQTTLAGFTGSADEIE